MARKYNPHEVHPITYIFVVFMLLLTLAGIAPLFNNSSRDIRSSAQIAGAHPTATRTRTPTPQYINCGGVRCLRQNCQCADGDACTRVVCVSAVTPTRTRTPTSTRLPTPTSPRSCLYPNSRECMYDCSGDGSYCASCHNGKYQCTYSRPTPNPIDGSINCNSPLCHLTQTKIAVCAGIGSQQQCIWNRSVNECSGNLAGACSYEILWFIENSCANSNRCSGDRIICTRHSECPSNYPTCVIEDNPYFNYCK